MLDPPVLSAAPEPKRGQQVAPPQQRTSATVRVPFDRCYDADRDVSSCWPQFRPRLVGGTIERWQQPPSHRGPRTGTARPLLPVGVCGVPRCSLSAPPAGRNWQARRPMPGCRRRRTASTWTAGLGAARQRRPGLRSADATTATAGRLALAAGVVWFAQDWEGWERRPGSPSFGASARRSCHSSSSHLGAASSQVRSGPARSAWPWARRACVRPRRGGRDVALVRDPLLDRQLLARTALQHASSSTPIQALPGARTGLALRRR